MSTEKAMGITRNQLGELASMSNQTQAAEQKILDRAQALLAECEGELKKLRPAALAGDEDAARQYQDKTLDKGRLEKVILQAREALGGKS